jgi:hypothetical protein
VGLSSPNYVRIRLRVHDFCKPGTNAARFLMVRHKGFPTASANVAQGQQCSVETRETLDFVNMLTKSVKPSALFLSPNMPDSVNYPY